MWDYRWPIAVVVIGIAALLIFRAVLTRLIGDTDQAPKSVLARRLVLLAVILLIVFVAFSFFLKDNPVAQFFFNLIFAVITTIISVLATQYYAAGQSRDELIRYGLQAWRTLNSLQVKVSQHLASTAVASTTLQAWVLDIDGAKWAWKDLLGDVFKLQDRLQSETDEVVLKYKDAIEATEDVAERTKLETKQAAEVAVLASKAPLPIKLPERVTCPLCEARTTARIGSTPGDSAWPICSSCRTRFQVFRVADGSIENADRMSIATVTNKCPGCSADISIPLYDHEERCFLCTCPTCHTHIKFTGSPEKQVLEDLGSDNAEFTCPYCENKSKCWIAPGKKRSFRMACRECRRYVQIAGTKDNFTVTTSEL